MAYISLHNHSWYSLLDSAMAVEDIVAAAVEYGMPAVGLVDRDSLAGAVQFYKAARAAGVHPVIGSEVTLAGGGSLVLLVENAVGYYNLCRLLSTRIEHPDGVTPEDLNLCSAATAIASVDWFRRTRLVEPKPRRRSPSDWTGMCSSG